MPRRMAGRMVRTMGRTAVVAGTATAVSGRVARRQQGKMVQDQQATGQQPPPAPAAAAPAPQPPAAAPPSMEERVEALERLAALKEQGFLTDEEFAAQKAKLLAG